MIKRIEDLGIWLSETMAERKTIQVSGGLRDVYQPDLSLIPALELSGPTATTVRVILPPPPAQINPSNACAFILGKDKNGKDEKPLTNSTSSWWAGWSKILTASTLLSPRTDAVRLADLMQDRRLIRLFCDTNALASGVAEWLIQVLPSGTQLISSAIADKEIMSWADRYKTLYLANNAECWDARLRFLLARRLTEYPPGQTVIDRLSPDQNALMLAQGTTEGAKSSQGDLLFVELARPLVRQQPRQARVVFLTGDANVARAATSALGPEHVLYANPDVEQMVASQGQVLSRGFWHPIGPLGSLSLPPIERLLFNLLAAFSFLVLKQGTREYLLTPAFSVRHGGPSDWANPWVKITEITKVVKISAISDDAELQVDDPSTEAEVEATQASNANPATQTVRLPQNDDYQSLIADKWLLEPRTGSGDADSLSSSPRPAARLFFEFVGQACFGNGVELPTQEVAKETFRVLVGLRVIAEDGTPGPRIEEFREAWNRNDRDWFHAELIYSHPGYRNVAEEIRQGKIDTLKSRESQFIPLMRALGQTTKKFPLQSSPARMGDAPVSAQQLDAALLSWLPQSGSGISASDACVRGMDDLSITPSRFEIALTRLWKLCPEYPVEGRTGGEPVRMASENVVELLQNGLVGWRQVSPAGLTFGGALPIFYLVRRR